MPTFDLQNPAVQEIILITVSLWSLVWKGLSLWKAAHKEQKTWFILLLVINTLGILEIVYYFWLSKFDYSGINKKLIDFKNKVWHSRK